MNSSVLEKLPVDQGKTVYSGKEYVIEEVPVQRKPVYSVIKRAFDIFASLLGLIVLCIPMVVIGIIVRVTSPGPAIYKQERLGKNGQPFTIYKFRSMYQNAEDDGPRWAEKDDARITKTGKFLRNTRLDELPQLWCILTGDMSLVGPRPERACFYEEFETYIHGFRHRLAVSPGLTGWAQINGGYELAPEEKIIYDMEYIQNRSLKMDLVCIWKTIRLVFTHEGAH